MPATGAVEVTVIVPAYNQAAEIAHCLQALLPAGPDTEIIVVDDASTDGTALAAGQPGVRLLRLADNRGPAAARNHGARHAGGRILFFVDADVVAAPGAVDAVKRVLAARPDVAAVFGSYDARPRAAGTVSQYRNLLHHFVHQTGNPDASTFWAGCGAVRRAAFESVGGFDAIRFPRPSIEDIELGYRLRRHGHRILLDRTLQGTHLKRWTWPAYVWTDITRRAIPWARLTLESEVVLDDLNLRRDQRLSAALVALAGLALAATAFRPSLALVAAGALAGVVAINRRLFAFLRRQRGFAFALRCVPLHLLYYLYSGASYALVSILWRVRRAVGDAGHAARSAPGR